jgi:hypothetical protein
VKVFLNEFEKKKFEQLKIHCSDYLNENKDVSRAIEIYYFNQDFDEIFDELFPFVEKNPSLVYLDQCGIKYISSKYVLRLEKTSQTDFLYFVASSSIWRFGEQQEFQSHLQVDIQELKKRPYKFIHRTLIDHLQSSLPSNTKLRLYPFSIKKGTNIYGIVFGASHVRAVEKFLSIAWKRNERNGEANFDIDGEGQKSQFDLFDPQITLTKLEIFQRLVEEKIMTGEIFDNIQLFVFTLEKGHIGKHAADKLKKMKKEGKINYEGRSPLITYENYKSSKNLPYEVIAR